MEYLCWEEAKMMVWILLILSPFLVLMILEEGLQLCYQRYVYGSSKVEKKLVLLVHNGWRKIHHKNKTNLEG